MVISLQNILFFMPKKYLTIVMALAIIAVIFFIFRKNYMRYNSMVSIVNTRWPKVHIQVREGNNPDPMHNKLIFDQYLTKGQSRMFTVDDSDNIMYRRDTDPNYGDSVHFTNWIVAKSDNSSTFILDNP
jgi:hypothetical protein